jgi:hypothetical protein
MERAKARRMTARLRLIFSAIPRGSFFLIIATLSGRFVRLVVLVAPL